MKKVTILTMVFVAVALIPVSATIINVPADQPNIQAGIDASSNGDIVRVASGTYVENIDFSGKNIVVGSWFLDDGDTSFISSTIIDGNQSGNVVSFLNGEDNTAVITGFTIQNGNADYGGGIFCDDNSNPMISHNTISGNSADSGAGGIYCSYSNPAIANNTISGNSSVYRGGGICCYYSSPTINYNTISGNSTSYGGGILLAYSSPTISNNTISGNSGFNRGGGISFWFSSPMISNNTISGNSSNYSGGGIDCWHCSPVITNTIFWGDTAPDGPEIYLYGTSSPVITYCDVQGGWAGEGNIDCDPYFCDPETDNFYLAENSCCAGAGENGVDIGALGVGCEPTAVGEDQPLPFEYSLSQNYPNPFNASTVIQYSLPSASFVNIEIYDILGRKVETLVQGEQREGYHQVIWDAEHKPSGIYFYRVQAGDYAETKKMLLLK